MQEPGTERSLFALFSQISHLISILANLFLDTEKHVYKRNPVGTTKHVNAMCILVVVTTNTSCPPLSPSLTTIKREQKCYLQYVSIICQHKDAKASVVKVLMPKFHFVTYCKILIYKITLFLPSFHIRVKPNWYLWRGCFLVCSPKHFRRFSGTLFTDECVWTADNIL